MPVQCLNLVRWFVDRYRQCSYGLYKFQPLVLEKKPSAIRKCDNLKRGAKLCSLMVYARTLLLLAHTCEFLEGIHQQKSADSLISAWF